MGEGGGRVVVDDLPLRPMTSAEVLDAAVGVFRRRPWRLLGLALALAALEQLVLYPLRTDVLARPHVLRPFGAYQAGDYLHALDVRAGGLGLLVAAGMATEALVITLLGGVASRSAVGLLLAGVGQDAGAPPPLRRYAQLVLAAVVVAAGAGVTFLAGGAPWVFWFLFTGLVAPSLFIDGAMRAVVGVKPPMGALRAIGRSFQLVGRGNLRPGGLRLIGYLTWFLLRMLVGAAGVASFVALFELSSDVWAAVIGYTIWTVINAVAYASMASLDATIQVETRMRLEGLDISLGRAAATRTPVAAVLAAPTPVRLLKSTGRPR
jgi:hypothetical protein